MKYNTLIIFLIYPLLVILSSCSYENNPVVTATEYKTGGSFDTLYVDENGDLVYKATMYLGDEYGRPVKDLKSKNLLAYLIYDNKTSGKIKHDRILKNDSLRGKPDLVPFSQSGKNVAAALTMDYSSSMGNAIYSMEDAVITFINSTRSNDLIEIIKFSTGYNVVQSFTNDKTKLIEAVNNNYSTGSTALYKSILKGLDDSEVLSSGFNKAVVAFTDGKNNQGSSEAEVINRANSYGIPVFTVGLGSADSYSLQYIAESTGGFCYITPNESELKDIYSKISGVFQNSYQVIVRWKASDMPESGTSALFLIRILSDDGDVLADYIDHKEHIIP